MLRLAVQMARHRISALPAVVCAVLGGAALITGTGVLTESGLRSQLPPGRLGGADILVSADQTFRGGPDLPLALPERGTVPAELVEKLARLPGVTAAVGDIGFPVGLLDARGRAVPVGDPRTAGHNWSSFELLDGADTGGPEMDGKKPSGSGEIAVDSDIAAASGVKPGGEVRVVAAGRAAADYRVSAVIDAPGAGVLFADPTAARLAGSEGGSTSGPRSGTVDMIGLRTEPGTTDKVAAAVRAELRAAEPRAGKDADGSEELPAPQLVVATGTDRGDLAAPDAVAARSLLILLSSSLAGIILLITGFVTAGALGVAIAGQRRELALMRAVGATPKQIRRLAADQATVIAALALVPGIPFGYLLAGQFRRLLVDRGVLPEALPLTYSPLPALATILLLALAVQVSARGAARRTSRMPATEAVAESRSEPRNPSRLRTGAGLLLIVAATTLSVVPLLSRTALGATATSIGGIIAAIGLAMAGPALVRGVSGTLARRLPAGASPATWLAMSNVRGYAIRIAGVVSTLAMAVVFTLTYTLAQTTVLTATTNDVRAGTLAQERLSAPGLGGIPEGTLAAVRGTSGVRDAAPVTTTTVLWPYEQLGDPVVESGSAMVLDPSAPDVLDLDVRSGSLARLTGDTVAVGSDVATSRDANVGQRISLILGDGTRVTPRVAAVYSRSLGFGPVVVSRDLAIDHTTTRLDQTILIRTDDSATARDNLAALAASRPGLSLEPADTTGARLSDAPPEVWVNLATIAVLLGYLLLSIANKLTATTAQRRTEIATLRLNGTTPRQIRAMMRREAALIAAAALVAGLAVSAIPLALLGIGFLDHPWPAGPVWLLPAIALTVVSIAFLTIELPTRRALRTSPAAALASHE
ncbi:membrane protein [Streptomyces camponoticapitis]|uniref:Membrane protein n=1 Tax=Streptomyces camponoticapitis TaxID=1616125 RepID=A0ABQ2E8D4_9ACTN|nr:ABC transporter permease [Streptomyces camponoticapitis]GGJ97168.1 membrane protein [Streptomyces camponoticapitis]